VESLTSSFHIQLETPCTVTTPVQFIWLRSQPQHSFFKARLMLMEPALLRADTAKPASQRMISTSLHCSTMYLRCCESQRSWTLHLHNRPDARQTVQRLRDAGIRVMVLSGDNATAARALAGRAGIAAADVTAGVGPGGKVDFVEQLKRGGAVRRLRLTLTREDVVETMTQTCILRPYKVFVVCRRVATYLMFDAAATTVGMYAVYLIQM